MLIVIFKQVGLVPLAKKFIGEPLFLGHTPPSEDV